MATEFVKTWSIKPPLWTGHAPLRIAILADPHVGYPIMSLRRLHKIVNQINALNADIIMMLGDYRARYLYRTTRIPLDVVAQELARLSAPLGVYGVLGNHDWWDDHPTMRRGYGPCVTETVFRDAGLNMLENESLIIDGRFNLIGLGDQWAFKTRGGFRGVDDLETAMLNINPELPNILLAHEPDIFPTLPNNIALTLSGHTHGGQVIVAGKAAATASKYGTRYVYGHIHENERDLIVSAGLGTSVAPIRFGRSAEITVVEIK